MTRMLIAAGCVLLTGCSPWGSAPSADPQGYVVRLAVTPAPGGAAQRIDLPAEALAALHAPDRADLRIFDRDGTPLAMALVAPEVSRGPLDIVRAEALPILGSAGALADGDAELRVEQRDGSRIVTVTRSATPSTRPVTLGALFDTRAITAPARGLRLDALLPPQQPIRFRVETSTDLANWAPAGGKTLYRRSADAGGAIGSEMIPLDTIDLDGRYLRVTWTSPQRLLAPVEIRGVLIDVDAAPGDDARPAIATSPPRRIDAHDIRFTLPAPAVLSAVAIEPVAGEMLLPVRVLGRNAPEQGWMVLGSGSLRGRGGRTIELNGAAFSAYRIEADRRTAGFAAPPSLRLLLEPARLVVLFNGRPPYRLAAGASGIDNRYLPVDELLPGYRPGAEEALPQAAVARSATPVLDLAPAEDGPFSLRTAVLWGLLLLGVVALGLMVWRLWRPARAG